MSDVTFREVEEILALLENIEANIELEWGDLRIEVRRFGSGPEVAGSMATCEAVETTEGGSTPNVPAASDSVGSPSVPGPGSELSGKQDVDPVPETWCPVTAPMAGTFYRSPKPGEPPYASESDLVSANDTVALIEVMKLYTELRAGVSGRVVRIAAEDGALVEHGQPLLWIEPA